MLERDSRFRKWFWLGVWGAIVIAVACGAATQEIPPPENGMPQPDVEWTLLPTATTTPTPWWRPTPSATALDSGSGQAAAVSDDTLTVTVEPSPTPTPYILGRISVPRVGIDANIIAVGWHLEWLSGQQIAVWDVAKDDAGWHQGTAPPGEPGNCVLSGHIKGTVGGVFRGLSDVVVGDEIWLYTADGRTVHYVVDEALLLRETGSDLAQRAANAQYMDPTEDTRLTLVTCWPNWAYTHRVVVIARPIGDS